MSQKKSVLFVCYGLGIGGIEKCLVNLINILPEDRYDVDVLLMNAEYTMKPQIRRTVTYVDEFQHILNAAGTPCQIRDRGGIRKNPGKAALYIPYRILYKLDLSSVCLFRPIEKHYDIAVAYAQNGDTPYYVIDKVRADRKILWYHNGAYAKTGWRYRKDQKYYPRFDYIVAVSEDCAKVLLDRFDIEDKIVILRNVCDAEAIRKSAAAFQPQGFPADKTHIVSVGRIASEKGIHLALEVCRQLLEEGRNLVWHWVGGGDDLQSYQKAADELGLGARFVFEGPQENPYPFMHQAYLYAQPSYFEAYSTTITEAKVLCKPIVVTDVGGMREQLEHGQNAMIVPIEKDAIADAIRTLMDDRELYRRFAEALATEDYSSTHVLESYEKSVFA